MIRFFSEISISMFTKKKLEFALVKTTKNLLKLLLEQFVMNFIGFHIIVLFSLSLNKFQFLFSSGSFKHLIFNVEFEYLLICKAIQVNWWIFSLVAFYYYYFLNFLYLWITIFVYIYCERGKKKQMYNNLEKLCTNHR